MRTLKLAIALLATLCMATVAFGMNKKEMAEALASRADMTKTKAAEIVNIIFSTTPGTGIIATELDAGRKVAILGFGTFLTKRLEARTVASFVAAPALTTPDESAPDAGQSAIAKKLASKANLPLTKARAVIGALFDTKPGHGIIADALRGAITVQLRGFGTLETVEKRVRFKPGKALLERIAE